MGCTGRPGENAPVLNEINALPLVVVPSGNKITWGHLLSIALRRMFPAAWCRDAADTRSTGIICTQDGRPPQFSCEMWRMCKQQFTCNGFARPSVFTMQIDR